MIKHTTFCLLTFFYLLSALEVNACGIQNAFFDDFDTYIESKEQSIEKTTTEQKKKYSETSLHLFPVPNTYFVNPTFLFQTTTCSSLCSPSYRLQNRNLTILHSVWQI